MNWHTPPEAKLGGLSCSHRNSTYKQTDVIEHSLLVRDEEYIESCVSQKRDKILLEMRSATGHQEARDIRSIIKFCRNNQILIAIATAQPDTTFFHPTQRSFVRVLGFNENDLQYCPGIDSTYDTNGSLKGPMLQDILKESWYQTLRICIF